MKSTEFLKEANMSRATKKEGIAEVSDTTLKNYIGASAGDAINRQNISNRSGEKDPKIAKRNAGQERAEKKLQGVAEGNRTMSRAAKGHEKYGKEGMKALAKAGREGSSEKKLDTIRDKHDKYNESMDPADQGEYDREGEMAIRNLTTAEDAADELRSILDADDNLPEWVQKKITLAVDYLDTARDYMKSKGSQDDINPNEKSFIEETYHGDEFYEAYGEMYYNEDEQLDEAEYQGRKVTLGKPMQGDVKKFKVYVKNPKGNVVKVNFGDPNMRIKKSNPARRKSFRARHNCDNPGPRHKARYWSCRAW